MIHEYQSTIRTLLCKALQLAIHDFNNEAAFSILDFSVENRFIVNITTEELDVLI